MPGFDLDAYLERIGAAGVRGASVETLEAIHAAHPAAIPFENLNPLLGWPVGLDAASIQKKLVAERRGGWCFEHNTLFQMALEALGFRVTPLGARVLWNMPEGTVTARSHMLLRVEAGGQAYLADVGFGGITLTSPLPWEIGVAQKTRHEPHRIVNLENGYALEVLIGDQWNRLYRFTDEAQFPADYEVSNWFLCTNPSSFFRDKLIGARATADCRYALRNTELSIHRPAGTEKRIFSDPLELRECLESEIAIQLPDAPDLDQALARICLAAAV